MDQTDYFANAVSSAEKSQPPLHTCASYYINVCSCAKEETGSMYVLIDKNIKI